MPNQIKKVIIASRRVAKERGNHWVGGANGDWSISPKYCYFGEIEVGK